MLVSPITPALSPQKRVLLQKPTVAIWKDGWLPKSETFILGQMARMAHWDQLKLGLFSTDDPLAEADYTPYTSGKLSRAFRVALRTRPFRGKYLGYIRESNAKLFHAHFGSGGVNSLPLAMAANLPSITTFHGTDATNYGSNSRYLNARYLHELGELFDYSSLLLPVSRYVADKLIATGAPANKIHVHYIGTEIVPVSPSLGQRVGIVFVGRLVEMKGLTDLFKAVSLLPPALRSVRVTIVGDGPLKTSLEKLAADLRLNVSFLGWQPSIEVRRILATGAIFCGPSHTLPMKNAEGFGMVYLEASLQELPVVAYDVGGSAEAVANDESGILVAERDVAALSGAIRHLLIDEDGAARLGRSGRQRVIDRFDIAKQTADLEDIYSRITL